MTPVSSKLYTDDVSLLMVLIDTNPFFWNSLKSTLPFSKFLTHVLAFLNSILLLNQLNQVVVIATGYNSCDYIFDSSDSQSQNQRAEQLLQKLEEFVDKDESLCREGSVDDPGFSLLSGSLSMALCCIHLETDFLFLLFEHSFMVQSLCASFAAMVACINFEKELFYVTLDHIDIQRVFRSGPLHPQPRILCLHGSPDRPGQYVAVMNSIFSAQRSMVPIDACVIGAQNSAFLQQASYITGGVYMKPHILDGLFQYLSTVFATDLHSRCFLQLPKPAGVDFRASCFCHKNTIDMGYICSVCLSIFCKNQKKCSTCGSVFGEARAQESSTPDRKRKTLVDA